MRRQFKNTGAAAIKQTGKFSAVLQMFLGTVSITNAGWQAVPDAWTGDGK